MPTSLPTLAEDHRATVVFAVRPGTSRASYGEVQPLAGAGWEASATQPAIEIRKGHFRSPSSASGHKIGPDGKKEVSLASPDGIAWEAFAYFTNAPTESYAVLVDEDGRLAEDEHGNLLPAIPIED